MANLDINKFLSGIFNPPSPDSGVGTSRAIRLDAAQQERPNPLVQIFQAGTSAALGKILSLAQGTPLGQQATTIAQQNALASVTTSPAFLVGIGLLIAILAVKAAR